MTISEEEEVEHILTDYKASTPEEKDDLIHQLMEENILLKR
jgi:hypothetical protein